MPIDKLRIVSVLLGLALFSGSARGQFTQKQIQNYRQAVVRVDAQSCSGIVGGLQRGSGFLWKHDTWVVTALHVVNGCSTVSVYSDVAQLSSSAHVQRVLFDDDLALLMLDKTINGTATLDKNKQAPTDTQELLVVGFPSDGSGSTGKTIKRQFSGDKLRSIVSIEVQQELSKIKSPSLDTVVIFLQGILEHGHSGGPLVDHDGYVVGIADGGLKHGVTEDSWAIPGTDLDALADSSDDLNGLSAHRSQLLFAANPMGNPGSTFSCGGGNFTLSKTVSYSDVLLTADDPKGLQQLAVASGLNPVGFQFDVYQDLATGATVVLPAGEKLTPGANTCIATSPGGGVISQIRISNVGNDPTGQTAALQFEGQVMGISPGWFVAPAYSYLQPLPVIGGALSVRKDWVHYQPLVGAPGQWNFQQFDAQQFETLAMRGSTLLGVVAQYSRWNPIYVQIQTGCRYNAQFTPNCAQASQDDKDWVQSTFAVHLSTLAGTY